MRPSCALALAVVVCLMTGTGRAQETTTNEEWASGYNGFALICRSLGLEPDTNISRWADADPRKSILVVLGGRGRNGSRQVDLQQYVADGGAVLFASDERHELFDESIRIVRPLRDYWRAADSNGMFYGQDDCLVVSTLPVRHPVTQGIQRIVTNRTAGLQRGRRNRTWRELARLPRLSGAHPRYGFLAARDDPTSRMLVCADQSIFSNQMLVHGDNARLALQAMNWLKQGNRTHLLILMRDRNVSPQDPQALNVAVPPPSREEVLNAIRSLPPDLLLEFGNEIATLVEDENLVNELMPMLFEDVSDKRWIRGLIFFATLLLAGFLFYRYMSSESTIQDAVGTDTEDLASSGLGWWGRRRKAAQDRMTVARELVTRFYKLASGGHHDHYFGFPANLQFVNCEGQKELEKGMRQTGKFLKGKSRRWWTQERLLGLQAQIDYWERLFANGQLVFVSAEEADPPDSPDELNARPTAGPDHLRIE